MKVANFIRLWWCYFWYTRPRSQKSRLYLTNLSWHFLKMTFKTSKTLLSSYKKNITVAKLQKKFNIQIVRFAPSYPPITERAFRRTTESENWNTLRIKEFANVSKIRKKIFFLQWYVCLSKQPEKYKFLLTTFRLVSHCNGDNYSVRRPTLGIMRT